MIPGAIDESALLHVHTSYLTRYSADEFSALIGFPLFLIASLCRLSRFPPLSPVLRALLVLGLLSSLLSRALRRNRSYCSRRRRRSRCLFLSPAMPPHSRSEKPDSIFICWCTIRLRRFPEDRRSPIDDSDRKVDEDSVFAPTKVSYYFQLRGKMSINPASPRRGKKVAKIT